jgi:hypothetical protein
VAVGYEPIMRILLLVASLISVVVILGVLVAKRPGREPQPEPIDAHHDPHLPAPEATRAMDDPPPGSRGDREEKGMP